MCSLFQNINYLHLGKNNLDAAASATTSIVPKLLHTGETMQNTIVSNIPGMFNVCVKCLQIPFYYTVCIHFAILSLT